MGKDFFSEAATENGRINILADRLPELFDEKTIRDNYVRAIRREAFEQGLKEGREKGREESREESREEGREEGRASMLQAFVDGLVREGLSEEEARNRVERLLRDGN